MSQGMKQLLLSTDPVGELRELVSTGELITFEPVLADLKMDIPKGYHHKDNLEHSIRVLGNALDLESEVGGSPDLVLRTAALLHDIGKPATRKFAGGGKVTFQNHEVIGARMVPSVLRRHGYAAQEIGAIKRLVRLHMRSHGFDNAKWNDSAVRRLMTDAENPEALSQLIVVFKADCTTKNDRKRRSRFASMESLNTEVERVRRQDARRAMRPAFDGHEVMDMLGLSPGRELGAVMKFLNSDEGVALDAESAREEILRRFG